MTVQIKIKSVYGKDLIYPANETAEKFVRLLDKKTFTKEQLVAIQALGYEVQQVNAYSLLEVKNG